MAKKIRFESSTDNFTLIGVTCPLKDYRLCFFLNQKLGFSFSRRPDLFIPGSVERSYSFYYYPNNDERRSYFLLANHHPEGRLIPGQKGLDYLLFIDDKLASNKSKELAGRIQSITHVQAAFPLDPSKIKNLDALLEDIEIHVMSF